MTVALVLPDLRGGGAERVALTLAEDMIRAGHDVDLVLLGSGGELLPLVPAGARIVELKAPRFRRALLPLLRYFRSEKPNSVQAFMWPVTVLTVIAHHLARNRGRLVLSDHATLSRQYRDRRSTMAALRWSTFLFYRHAHARVCVSEGVAEDLASISTLPREAFTVIYNPVIPPKEPITPSTEVEKLWPGSGPRILTVGSLKAEKNQALLIRAFATLAKDTSACLMLLGEGELRSLLEELAEHLGVADRVVFPGFAADPWPYYASADLFVLSSNYEGYGNVLVEAMLAGVPVVSTDCIAGPSEILDDGRYGRLVPIGDAEALAAAMLESLEHLPAPELLKDRAEQLSAGSLDAYRRIMLGDSATACTPASPALSRRRAQPAPGPKRG